MNINAFKKITLILGTTLFLQGCVALGLGGAAVATKVGTDPRTIGTQVDDETLEFKVYDAVTKDEQIKEEARVVVVAYSGRVLLTGQVPDENLKSVVKSLAEGVEGVNEVYEQMQVGTPANFKQKSQDSWITAKIKSDMLVNSEVKTTSVKVVTENNVVYLMGNLTRNQANAAAEIASKINGVEKVVKAFKYID